MTNEFFMSKALCIVHRCHMEDTFPEEDFEVTSLRLLFVARDAPARIGAGPDGGDLYARLRFRQLYAAVPELPELRYVLPAKHSRMLNEVAEVAVSDPASCVECLVQFTQPIDWPGFKAKALATTEEELDTKAFAIAVLKDFKGIGSDVIPLPEGIAAISFMNQNRCCRRHVALMCSPAASATTEEASEGKDAVDVPGAFPIGLLSWRDDARVPPGEMSLLAMASLLLTRQRSLFFATDPQVRLALGISEKTLPLWTFTQSIRRQCLKKERLGEDESEALKSEEDSNGLFECTACMVFSPLLVARDHVPPTFHKAWSLQDVQEDLKRCFLAYYLGDSASEDKAFQPCLAAYLKELSSAVAGLYEHIRDPEMLKNGRKALLCL